MNSFVHRMLGHYLMEEAGADGAASGGADAGAAPGADGTTSGSGRPDTLLAGTTPPEGQQPPATPDGQPDPTKNEDGSDKVVEAAPEAYTDFTVPDGLVLDEAVIGEFQGLAKELNISQASAQKLIDLQTKLMTQAESARGEQFEKLLADQRQAWADEVKNDKELGGANFQNTVTVAGKAVQAFLTPGARQLLIESGLGNNPEFVRSFHAIGKAMSEDSMVFGGTQQVEGRKSDEDVFYPQTK